MSQGLRTGRKTKEPCAVCFMHPERCICEFIPKLNLKTRLCLVVHYRELRRTTNTGSLAVKALINSEMRVRGEDRAGMDLSAVLNDEYRTVLFYPSEDAQDLTAEFVAADPRPIQMIVPDGNWRQASKVHYRHKELKDVPRVMIKAANTAKYHLRAEHMEEDMATLQAIAHAMGVLEGPEVKEELLKLYNLKLERTLLGRGIIPD